MIARAAGGLAAGLTYPRVYRSPPLVAKRFGAFFFCLVSRAGRVPSAPKSSGTAFIPEEGKLPGGGKREDRACLSVEFDGATAVRAWLGEQAVAAWLDPPRTSTRLRAAGGGGPLYI